MAEAMESDPSHPDGSDDLSEGLGDVIRIEHGPFRPGEYKVALPKAKSQPLRCLFRSMGAKASTVKEGRVIVLRLCRVLGDLNTPFRSSD